MSFNDAEAFRVQQQERTAPRCEPRRVGMTLANGRFELVKPLGGGGMGEVWQALDRRAAEHGNAQADGEVALKFLPLELAGHPTMLQQFQKTFASIRKVQGRYLCPLYDMQVDERVGHFMVMKRVHGHDLAKVVELQGPLPLEKAVPIIEWAAAGLDELHEQHFVHRDVKPENIMLAPNDAIPLQIIDYGVSGEIRESVAKCTGNTGFEGGTYAYMSPERLRGKTRGGPPADQYALGCVAYYLLTGEPPFIGDPGIVRHCHLEEPVTPISGLSSEVNGVLLRALAKAPEQRFASCGDFARALRAAVTMVASPVISGAPRPGGATKPSIVIPRRGVTPPPPPNDTRNVASSHTKSSIVIPRRPASGTMPSTAASCDTAPAPKPAPIVIDTSPHYQPPPLTVEQPGSRIARSVNLTSAYLLGLAAAASGIVAVLVWLVCWLCWNAASTPVIVLALVSMLVCRVAPIAFAVSSGVFYGIAWSSLPEADPRLPTATAVALLAVPGFNLYWFYRFQYLLWQRLNAATQATGRGQPIPAELIWLQLVPFMGLVAYFMFQVKVTSAFRELRNSLAPGGA
jgi:serine/threonine protein kinase